MKEKLKNKKVIALIIGVIALIGILVFVFMSLNKSELILKSNEVIVEYGQVASTKVEDYLDLNKLDSKKKEKIIASAKLDLTIPNEAEKEYPGINEYNGSVTYEKDKAEFKVIVKDTTAPAFKDFKDVVETAKDVKPDYNALFITEDLSKVTIACDDKEVKYDTVGEYKAIIKATDESKNEISKEITIKVIEPSIKLDKETVSLYVKETAILKATIVGKEQKAIFKSSNDGIASVDAEGKITAKSKGTATITASANSKDAICKVTVKETPKGSTTETKKDGNGNTVTVVKPSAPSGSSNGGSTTIQSTAKTSKEAFNLINAERAKLGLAPAVWDGECERIALIRAKELLTDCSHNGFNKFQSENHKLGECIGWGYSSPSGIVNAWMNSEGHKDILMRENRTKLAVARQGDYWVAVNSR